MEELVDFCRKLIEMKQMSGLSDAVIDGMANDMANELSNRIEKAIISAMTFDEIDKLQKMLSENSKQEKVDEFIRNSSVDVDQITIQTMISFKEFYLGK